MTTATDDAQRLWRRAERARLLDQRKSLPDAERRRLGERVMSRLEGVLAVQDVRVLGIYWPIKREIDLRNWAAEISSQRKIRLALPVVTTPKAPLTYCHWHPAARMTRGFWNIPVPHDPVPVEPDVVIAPLVGFQGFWRLGYGGGYFDRTLASRTPRPKAIGIGFDFSETAEFVPQPHDIPMDSIVTETRTFC